MFLRCPQVITAPPSSNKGPHGSQHQNGKIGTFQGRKSTRIAFSGGSGRPVFKVRDSPKRYFRVAGLAVPVSATKRATPPVNEVAPLDWYIELQSELKIGNSMGTPNGVAAVSLRQ